MFSEIDFYLLQSPFVSVQLFCGVVGLLFQSWNLLQCYRYLYKDKNEKSDDFSNYNCQSWEARQSQVQFVSMVAIVLFLNNLALFPFIIANSVDFAINGDAKVWNAQNQIIVALLEAFQILFDLSCYGLLIIFLFLAYRSQIHLIRSWKVCSLFLALSCIVWISCSLLSFSYYPRLNRIWTIFVGTAYSIALVALPQHMRLNFSVTLERYQKIKYNVGVGVSFLSLSLHLTSYALFGQASNASEAYTQLFLQFLADMMLPIMVFCVLDFLLLSFDAVDTVQERNSISVAHQHRLTLERDGDQIRRAVLQERRFGSISLAQYHDSTSYRPSVLFSFEAEQERRKVSRNILSRNLLEGHQSQGDA